MAVSDNAEGFVRGDIVLVASRPAEYVAVVEYAGWHKLGVRPLAGQGMTLRQRVIRNKSVKKVVGFHMAGERVPEVAGV